MGSIVGNQYFNDPNIGQAFGNLASIFAPPSGPDLAGYAEAASRRAQAARLAELFSYAHNPTYDRSMADRLATAAGVYSPNQSYYAVDLGDQTTRRGQDLTAETSIHNNAADNVRALQTNSADNQRALVVDAADNENKLKLGLITPVAANATRYVPPDIANKFSIPEQQLGAIILNQGQQATLPDNRVLTGQKIPLTSSQQDAADKEELRAKGLVTDQMLADAQMSKDPLVQAILPGSTTPTWVTRGAAARTNAQAFNKETSQPTELTKLMQEQAQYPKDSAQWQAYQQRIDALGRGTVQPKYDQVNEENLANMGKTINETAQKSFADVKLLSSLKQAIDDPNTSQGAMGQATLTLKKYLNAFGIPAGNTSPAEMVNALGNTLALRLRDPSNGAGMPGALSDSDREFLKSMVVSLGNSPDANQKIVSYYLQLQQKNLGLEALRRQYVQQHGKLDEGFRAVMDDFLAQSGLGAAPGAAMATTPAANPVATDTAAKPVLAQPTAATVQQPAVEKWDFVNGKLQRVPQ